ncbi:lipoprotein insertase outer membrane protein LolB [Candidatus Nitrotoga sp. M5]|uniref:lipoprotein insertase outer membrane protein LolB n=1 Tax=Candidatus Nitrotoga sp. M5 TaxID=2890409 RepID=UPI001EF1BB0E|nr:lipoprotein insertase outer membrane protein LolB [Candidatus Nitrotoga sp. M5]
MQPEHLPFVLSGRIAVKHDGNHSSSGVRWMHCAESDEILLFAPLGQTVARIRSDPQGATLDMPLKHYEAKDADGLTQQVLGWRLPLYGLRYWVLALPAPMGAFDIEHNANGQVMLLSQDGWVIRYTRYAAQTSDGLPLRLAMQRDGLEIQLLIDEWEI